MKFPGSTTLHEWTLSPGGVTLDEIRLSSQKVALTGLAEVKFPQSMAMLFYYLGNEVNVVFREGKQSTTGQAALDSLHAALDSETATVTLYQMPLDLAHLLRGITRRRRLEGGEEPLELLEQLKTEYERAERTGTIEAQCKKGSGILLFVGGRLSNTYWETATGQTFEKEEARHALEKAIGQGAVLLFTAEFSRDAWKAREVVVNQGPMRERLEGDEGMSRRRRLLDEVLELLPAVTEALIFEAATGVVLVQKSRGSAELRSGLLGQRLPALLAAMRQPLAVAANGPLELVEINTEQTCAVLTLVPETQEVVALVADRNQPTSLLSASLVRLARAYGRDMPAVETPV